MRKHIQVALVLAAAVLACGCGRHVSDRPIQAGKGGAAASTAPGAGAPSTAQGEEQPDSVHTERDPVCGLYVDPKTAPRSDFEGKTYYFCSPEDKAKFDKDPGTYTSQAP